MHFSNYLRLPLTIIKNRLSLPVYPSFVTFLITWRCNAKCIMCEIWKKERGYEMDTNEIESIFRQLPNIDAIRLSGGEPFLREDLISIVEIINKRVNPRIIHITSNGLLTDKIVSFFEKINCREKVHLKISIDAIGEKHNYMRGVPDAYDKAIGTLEELSKLRKKEFFYLGVNQTIVDKECINHYHELSNISQKLGIKVHLDIAYDCNEIHLYKNSSIDFSINSIGPYSTFSKIPYKDICDIFEIIKKDSTILDNFLEKNIKKYFLKGLYNRLILKKNYPLPKCIALRSHLRILPNGDIPICLYNSTIIGNLLKEKFKVIWFGKRIEENREIIKRCPGCWFECETIPNAVYTGDIIKTVLF